MSGREIRSEATNENTRDEERGFNLLKPQTGNDRDKSMLRKELDEKHAALSSTKEYEEFWRLNDLYKGAMSDYTPTEGEMASLLDKWKSAEECYQKTPEYQAFEKLEAKYKEKEREADNSDNYNDFIKALYEDLNKAQENYKQTLEYKAFKEIDARYDERVLKPTKATEAIKASQDIATLRKLWDEASNKYSALPEYRIYNDALHEYQSDSTPVKTEGE